MKNKDILKHLVWIALFLFGFCTISCEDILDKYPEDKVTPETFYKNQRDLRLATNQFYVEMVPVAASIYEDPGDIIIQTFLDEAISNQRLIPETGGGWTWSALRNINFYLEHSNQCDDKAARIRYDAVARFFRAWFYFQKVQRFGDVPWYDHVLGSNDPDLYKPRDSREIVMQHVIADLDYAIDNLPSEKSLYEITKWTAQALKSRVALFEGTFRKYHGMSDYQKYLEACADISKKFITESGYSIAKTGNQPYKQLFANLNADGTEVILARDYGRVLGFYHNVQGYEVSPGTANMGVTKRLIDSYLMKDGTRFTDKDNYKIMQFYDECQNRDPRLSQTIRTPGYVRDDGKKYLPEMGVAKTGYQLIKYDAGTAYDGYSKSENDIPIFRAAEVYLNYAEAKAELGTLTQSDLDISIRPIRERVGMPSINLEQANANPDPFLENAETGYPNVDKGANKGVILEIRRERTIELVMEGFRYYDIMRWKEGKAFDQAFRGMYFPGPGEYDLDNDGIKDVYLYTGSNRQSSVATQQYQIGTDIILSEGDKGNVVVHSQIPRAWNEARDYYYPIPSKDRILTNGALTQNPGWEDNLDF